MATLTLVGGGMQGYAQPMAKWLETSHHFGLIHENDGLQSCDMRVVNTGDSALLLISARTNCGCTAAGFPRHPIAPGDTAVVTLTYQPLHRPGNFVKLATITTNVSGVKDTLTITGKVLASAQTLANDYATQAGSLYLSSADVAFGPLLRSQHRMGHITAYNAAADTLLITLLDVPDHIIPHAIPDTLPPGELSVVTLFYDAAKAPLWGFNADRFTLLSTPLHPMATAEAKSGHANIEVMAQVKEDFATLTERERASAARARIDCGTSLDFGTIGRATQQVRTFEIANTGRSPLLIRRLWSPDKGISATAAGNTIAPGKRVAVTVTADAVATEGKMLNASLTLITNDPEAPEQTLRLVGEIR